MFRHNIEKVIKELQDKCSSVQQLNDADHAELFQKANELSNSITGLAGMFNKCFSKLEQLCSVVDSLQRPPPVCPVDLTRPKDVTRPSPQPALPCPHPPVNPSPSEPTNVFVGRLFREHEALTIGMDRLADWTGKKVQGVLFDSVIDDFHPRVFASRVLNKKNIAVIAFTENGDVLGAFHNGVVSRPQTRTRVKSAFLFSLGNFLGTAPVRMFPAIADHPEVTVFTSEPSKLISFGSVVGTTMTSFTIANTEAHSMGLNLVFGFDGWGQSTYPDKHMTFKTTRVVAVKFSTHV